MLSRFEASPEQVARNARGLALCRTAIAPALAKLDGREPEAVLTESDRIRQTAIERAISERRARRQTGLEHFANAFPTTNRTSR